MEKQLLIEKHKELVKNGQFEAAKWLLNRLMAFGRGNANFTVWDEDGALYESGLADWLMATFRWHNGRWANFMGSFCLKRQRLTDEA